MNVDQADECPHCGGTGMVDVYYDDGDWDEAATCEPCHGTGWLTDASV